MMRSVKLEHDRVQPDREEELLDLEYLPAGEVLLNTYTHYHSYELATGDGPAISVPHRFVNSQGVGYNQWRDWRWQIMQGLHPFDTDIHASFCLCVRRRNGYWTPRSGNHSYRAPRVLCDGGGSDPPSSWHNLFTFHLGHLAVPASEQTIPKRQGLDDFNRGWIIINFKGQNWQLHTSIGGLFDLLQQNVAGADTRHLIPNFREKTLTIQVPSAEVNVWREVCGRRLLQALRLNAITICQR
ncbi:MAG: hypothetical protein Q7S64_02255 [bacterium]|nr:hypothetical protein [bacterium]